MEYLLIGRSRSEVGAGVGVGIFRPESESLEFHRLRHNVESRCSRRSASYFVVVACRDLNQVEMCGSDNVWE